MRIKVAGMTAALLATGLGSGAASAKAKAKAPAPGTALQEAFDPRPRLKGLTLSLDAYRLRPLDDDQALFGSRDDASAGGVEVSYQVARLGGAALAIGLGLLSERTADQGNAAGEFRLEAVSYHGSAILRFRNQSTFQPYLTVGGGLKRATLEVVPRMSSTGGLEDRAVTGFARGSLGLRALPRALIWKRASGNPVLGVAFAVEVGGILGADQRFELSPSQGAAGSEAPIRVEPVDAGRLGGAGLFSRFMLELVL